uniref:Uncharacterized protein n=1 Tax=Ananas comosus var. bracteatus TaxID=296719 RepID=A0A6V7P589_ANACO|nr:unnamed protein product [Ananas comosus var. bracteatus]
MVDLSIDMASWPPKTKTIVRAAEAEAEVEAEAAASVLSGASLPSPNGFYTLKANVALFRRILHHFFFSFSSSSSSVAASRPAREGAIGTIAELEEVPSRCQEPPRARR